MASFQQPSPSEGSEEADGGVAVQQASAVVWRWSEVKPANGQCSSIMRLRRPLSGARGGELPLWPRLPSDIACPAAQEQKKKERKKETSES